MNSKSETTESLMKERDRLNGITIRCRLDMHEPDEQGVSAVVSGFRLDNAFGEDPCTNQGEFTVGIIMGSKKEWFNLATLIALARQADI